MCKKPITELAKEVHYEPLPGEVRAVVIAAWQRGGLLIVITRPLASNGLGLPTSTHA